MQNFTRTKLIMIAVILCSTMACFGQAITVIGTNPTDKKAGDGFITIHGLAVTTQYSVKYDRNGTTVAAANYTTDMYGNIVIPNLDGATYTNIAVTTVPAVAGGATNTQNLGQTVVLVGGAIATQATKFFGAVYGNFTGVPDDNPGSFVQTYARLSQYLNAKNGIAFKAKFKQRFIFFRNFIAQVTYGNTDGFNTYSVDTLGDKYTNRMDLLAHAYLNGSVSLNLLTFIVPDDWTNNSGDMAHIYFDVFHSFLGTNVTDTLAVNNSTTNKNYRVYSSMFGLNLKASFVSTLWNIDAAARIFEIHPWSGTVNPNLNVQTASISDVYLAENSKKDFVRQSNPPYFQFEVQVQYNTGAASTKSAGNQSNSTNNSNAFIRYSYAANFANPAGNHYPNNYFQLQLGYAIDITKLLQGSSSATTTNAVTQ